MSQNGESQDPFSSKLQPRILLPLSPTFCTRWGRVFFVVVFFRYNRSMETESRTTCRTCGRPWDIKPGCPVYDGCLCEYCGTMPACIKKKQPDCLAKAVIPAITVENVDGIANLANCFVHATSTNTTYYVDDKHRVMITWAGPVEMENYDYENNPLSLRSQTCYTAIDGVFSEIYFDKTGVAHIIGKES